MHSSYCLYGVYAALGLIILALISNGMMTELSICSYSAEKFTHLYVSLPNQVQSIRLAIFLFVHDVNNTAHYVY